MRELNQASKKALHEDATNAVYSLFDEIRSAYLDTSDSKDTAEYIVSLAIRYLTDVASREAKYLISDYK